MANPNIIAVTAIYGYTAGLAVPTSPSAIVTNAAASGLVYKINALYVGNINTSTPYKITVSVVKGSTPYRMLYQVSVPAGSGLDVLSKAIYLQEGDSIQLSADTVSTLEAVCSYETIAGPP